VYTTHAENCVYCNSLTVNWPKAIHPGIPCGVKPCPTLQIKFPLQSFKNNITGHLKDSLTSNSLFTTHPFTSWSFHQWKLVQLMDCETNSLLNQFRSVYPDPSNPWRQHNYLWTDFTVAVLPTTNNNAGNVTDNKPVVSKSFVVSGPQCKNVSKLLVEWLYAWMNEWMNEYMYVCMYE
jgi:hypothetical protein